MFLRVFDKTKEKEGRNEAVYELHTSVKENFECMRAAKKFLQNCLDNIEWHRFIVILYEEVK